MAYLIAKALIINNLTIFINRAPRFVNNKYTDVNYSLQIPFLL